MRSDIPRFRAEPTASVCNSSAAGALRRPTSSIEAPPGESLVPAFPQSHKLEIGEIIAMFNHTLKGMLACSHATLPGCQGFGLWGRMAKHFQHGSLGVWQDGMLGSPTQRLRGRAAQREA